MNISSDFLFSPATHVNSAWPSVYD